MVNGRHATRRVLAGIRHYYVVGGNGAFLINGEPYAVALGDLIIIWPGEQYAYESDAGVMVLIEFNIDTGDGIAHEDIAQPES